MANFCRTVVRISMILLIAAAGILLGSAVLLICAPDLFGKILRGVLICACAAGAAGLTVCLIRTLCRKK